MGRHTTLQRVLDKPFAIIGIVNVTPDSFFDGGKYFSVDRAIKHALMLEAQGADVLDIGGQSTRPSALPISIEEECKRIVPVIAELAKKTSISISVDTFNSVVAEKALDAGAHWVNDVSAGRFDAQMACMVAKKKCPVILMHSRQTPETMQQAPHYDAVVAEVIQELFERVNAFLTKGVDRENIIIDPGIGFAKNHSDNLGLLSHCKELVEMGFPVCLGTSRKSFIGSINPGADRLSGSLASITPAFAAGVKIFRVHDVEATKMFLDVLFALDECVP